MRPKFGFKNFQLSQMKLRVGKLGYTHILSPADRTDYLSGNPLMGMK